mgnify:FL=1|tara:strand:- start:269 stop:433 length:165 start_codon:yes stop_codon:yes gene_type:complete
MTTTGCICDSNAPHWHRSAVREREAVAWEVGYLRGVRDQEGEMDRADNPFEEER